MVHKPFESWIVLEEPLLPDEEQRLHEHFESCESCRQLSTSWGEVQGFFQELPMEQPSAGFTNRWQARLVDLSAQEIERKEKRTSWVFFAVTAGAAIFVLSIMVIQFFSSVQTPIQLFIYGATLIAGFLNLASAMQVALIPFIQVFIVSVPTIWWFIIAFTACLLTLVLTYSARKVLFPRRVSL
jgi:predicted anti-sigma-YlaC factor YlaD